MLRILKHEFLLQTMKTVSKKISPKTQKLLNEKRLAVKWSGESGISFRKIVRQLTFIFLMRYRFMLLRKKQEHGVQVE